MVQEKSLTDEDEIGMNCFGGRIDPNCGSLRKKRVNSEQKTEQKREKYEEGKTVSEVKKLLLGLIRSKKRL